MKSKLLMVILLFCIKAAVAQHNLVIKFDHKTVDNKEISLTKWKYYLSHFQFTGNRNYTFQPPFLVDAFLQDSVLFSIPAGNYDALEFWVGIDSATNAKGIQEGALDPMNGMYWTWNTGYINWKVEGRQRLNDSTIRLTHHIGGFLPPYNAMRRVKLVFDKELSLQASKNTRILIDVNLNGYLDQTTNFKNIMEPCKEALLVADAIPATFSLHAVKTD